MPRPEAIFAHVGRLLDGDGLLRGRRVVVTAGPTREPIDPVRFLSNRSSGKMGVALAAAAWRRGANVTLIAGPLAVPPPVGATLVPVETTAELLAAVTEHLPSADVLVMAAAPADFRPADAAPQKIIRNSDRRFAFWRSRHVRALGFQYECTVLRGADKFIRYADFGGAAFRPRDQSRQ